MKVASKNKMMVPGAPNVPNLDPDKMRRELEQKLSGVGPSTGLPGSQSVGLPPKDMKKQMLEKHCNRIREQIKSKQPGDPSIPILESILAKLEDDMKEDVVLDGYVVEEVDEA